MTYIEYQGYQYGPLPKWYTLENAPLCPECGVWCAVPVGESAVYHKSGCELGKRREAARQSYWQRVGALSPEGREEEYTMVDKRFKGHEEILIATGYHNPRDPGDWCYLIRCCCGAKDIAWNYEDAQSAARQHRTDVRTPAPTAPAKTPRNGGAVPKATKPARQATAQSEKKPRRVLY